MNDYLIAFPDEERALIELEPFGYAVRWLDPAEETGTEVILVWEQGTAMIGGAQVILSYKGNEPTLHPAFWAQIIVYEPDDALWEAFAHAPIIELSMPDEPPIEPQPSDFVTRSANLDFDIDTIAGINPLWAGSPDMGFPYR